MSNLNKDGRDNAFLDLEARLRQLEGTGDLIAEATKNLRASAKVFALASARLQRARARRRPVTPHLHLLKASA